MTSPQDHTGRGNALTRSLARLAVILLLAWAIHSLLGWARLGSMGPDPLSAGQIGLLLALLLAYALLLALPFVPGVEVGLMLMAVEGGWIAPFIYLATLKGLMLAFLIGRHLPQARLRAALADLRLTRACALLDRIAPLDQAARLALLARRLPRWVPPALLGQRHLMLALLVNLPGNALIGGGGGILMLSGFSGLFSWPKVLLTLAWAVAPVPLVVWAFDLRWPF
jgi:hypothetical protein